MKTPVFLTHWLVVLGILTASLNAAALPAAFVIDEGNQPEVVSPSLYVIDLSNQEELAHIPFDDLDQIRPGMVFDRAQSRLFFIGVQGEQDILLTLNAHNYEIINRLPIPHHGWLLPHPSEERLLIVGSHEVDRQGAAVFAAMHFSEVDTEIYRVLRTEMPLVEVGRDPPFGAHSVTLGDGGEFLYLYRQPDLLHILNARSFEIVRTIRLLDLGQANQFYRWGIMRVNHSETRAVITLLENGNRRDRSDSLLIVDLKTGQWHLIPSGLMIQDIRFKPNSVDLYVLGDVGIYLFPLANQEFHLIQQIDGGRRTAFLENRAMNSFFDVDRSDSHFFASHRDFSWLSHMDVERGRVTRMEPDAEFSLISPTDVAIKSHEPVADLAISVPYTPRDVPRSGRFSTIIEVVNQGHNVARNVAVTAQLADSFSIVSAELEGAVQRANDARAPSCTIEGNQMTCLDVTVGLEQTIRLTLEARAPHRTGLYMHRVTAESWAIEDPTWNDHSAFIAVQVVAPLRGWTVFTFQRPLN